MSNFGRFLYGGDYNPDQWLDRSDVLDEDIRLMKLASVTMVSLGIFAWATLEPEEGRFEFGWLDEIIERLHAAGISVDLATPSGAKPNWMAQKYPEIRRIDKNGHREPQNSRHNQCWSSPIYREKVRIIDTKLSQRYGKHPAVKLWHISNELGGLCFCDLCYGAFRQWLQARYSTLDDLNAAYWTKFWSSTYQNWEQINCIDENVHGLELDWHRFNSEYCVDFIKNEIAAIRAGGSDRPITTNFMGFFRELDYWKQAPVLDYISQDMYPAWHKTASDIGVACDTAMTYDLMRSMKGGKPWILMESTPSTVNWNTISRPKKPGMVRLSGLQAVAHGSLGVMYFQWRKGRGSSEKFHGAVVDHVGHEFTRTFQESAALGKELTTIPEIADATTVADVAVIYDWDVRTALDNSRGANNVKKEYFETAKSFYEQFWTHGVSCDIPESTSDFSKYKLIVAPMLYMVKPGVAERLEAFVEAGGVLIGTYMSGLVDQTDLCFQTGFPGPLRKLFGVWAEETDVPQEEHGQFLKPVTGNALGLSGFYAAKDFCDIVHLEGAAALATYGSDFYAGSPAVTINQFGKGEAYYLAARTDSRLLSDVVDALLKKSGITGVLGQKLPVGISAASRTAGSKRFTFVMNFNPDTTDVPLDKTYTRLSDRTTIEYVLPMAGYGCEILCSTE